MPILGSKGSESKEMTCPTNESRKDSELQANRMRLGECKLRVNLRIKSFPNRQGVVANPKRVETQLQLNHKSRNWKRPEPGAKQLFYKFLWVEGTSHDRCCLTTICKFVVIKRVGGIPVTIKTQRREHWPSRRVWNIGNHLQFVGEWLGQ